MYQLIQLLYILVHFNIDMSVSIQWMSALLNQGLFVHLSFLPDSSQLWVACIPLFAVKIHWPKTLRRSSTSLSSEEEGRLRVVFITGKLRLSGLEEQTRAWDLCIPSYMWVYLFILLLYYSLLTSILKLDTWHRRKNNQMRACQSTGAWDMCSPCYVWVFINFFCILAY